MKKLTLKSLQQQLNEIKALKANNPLMVRAPITPVTPVIPVTSVNGENKAVKSSLLHFQLLSWLLIFINKIPFINRFSNALKIYYAKTTIWKILVKLRKIFIIFNAVVGVYTVFSLTGLGAESLLVNFIGMGNTYVDIFVNLTKKLFNWFFDLFDYKVVPNVPKGNNNWFGGSRKHGILTQ
jgi:hypothetical protein